MAPTRQRQTADALVAAFNAMDVPTIISLRSPSCIRTIVPRSLNLPPTSNDAFEKHLYQLVRIFENFKLDVHDVVEDASARKVVMWLTARADTAAGLYENEYVWTMEFDESGEKIVAIREFVDTVVNKEFWPKLHAAMEQARRRDGRGTEES